jgi:hypothetical protein
VYNKAKIFNLALNALLLSKQIITPESDPSNEAKVLNSQWDVAFKSCLFDLDLDSTASQQNLELVHDFTKDPPSNTGQPGPVWKYAYKYPDKCAFFRRIVSCNVNDDKFTHHAKRVMIYKGQKVIFTNVPFAMAEYIPIDFPLQTLSAPAGVAMAYRLAWQSAPLIVGKGAKALRESIQQSYAAFKAEAQAMDERESFSFQSDENMSEFVKVRMS